MTNSLQPLTAADTARLIGELLDRAVLPADWREHAERHLARIPVIRG